MILFTHFFLFIFSVIFFVIQYILFSNRKKKSSIKRIQDQFVETLQKNVEESKVIMSNILEDIKSSERNISSISQKVAIEKSFIENNVAKTQEYKDRIERHQQQQEALQELYRNAGVSIEQLQDLLHKSEDIIIDYDTRKDEFEKAKINITTVNNDIVAKLQSSHEQMFMEIQNAETVIETMKNTIDEKTNNNLETFEKVLQNKIETESNKMQSSFSDILHTIVSTNKKSLEQQTRSIEEKMQNFKQSVQTDIDNFNTISQEKKNELLQKTETTTVLITKSLYQKQKKLEQDYYQWYNSYAKKFDELYIKVDGLGSIIDKAKQSNNAEIKSMGEDMKNMSLHIRNETKVFSQSLQYSKQVLQKIHNHANELDIIVKNNFESEKEKRLSIVKGLWETYKNQLEENNTISIKDFNEYVAKEKQVFNQQVQNGNKALDDIQAQAITEFNSKLHQFEQEFDEVNKQKQDIFLQFDQSSNHFNEEKNKYIQAMQNEIEEQKNENRNRLEELDNNCDMMLIGLQAKIEQLRKVYDNSLNDFQNELQTLKGTHQKEQETLLSKYNDVYVSFHNDQEERYKQFNQKTEQFFQEMDNTQTKEQLGIRDKYQTLLADHKNEYDNKYNTILDSLNKEYDTILENVKQNQNVEIQNTIQQYNSKIDELLVGYKEALSDYKERLEVLKVQQQSEQDVVIASCKESIDSLKIDYQKKLLEHQDFIDELEDSYEETIIRYSSTIKGLNVKYEKGIDDYQQHIQNVKGTVDEIKVKNDQEIETIRENFVGLIENYQEKTANLLDDHIQTLNDKEKNIDDILIGQERNYNSLCESVKKQMDVYVTRLGTFKDGQYKKVDSSIAKIKEYFDIRLKQYNDDMHAIEQEHRKVKDDFGIQFHTFQEEQRQLITKGTNAVEVFQEKQRQLQKDYEKQFAHQLSSINEETQKNFDKQIQSLDNNVEKKLSDISEKFEQALNELKRKELSYLKTTKGNLNKFDDQIKKTEKMIKNKELQLLQNITDLETEHKKYTDIITRDQQQQDQVRMSQSILDEKIEKLSKQTGQVIDKSKDADILFKKVNEVEVKMKEIKSTVSDVEHSFQEVTKVRKNVELLNTNLNQSDSKNKQLFYKIKQQNEKIQLFQETVNKIQTLQNEAYNAMHNIEEKNTVLQSKWQQLDSIAESIRDIDSLAVQLRQDYKDISNDVENIQEQYKDIKDIKKQVHDTKLLFPKIQAQLKQIERHRQGLIQDINSLSYLHETTESKITLIHELEPTLKKYANSRGLLDSKQNNAEMSAEEKEKLIVNLYRKQKYSEEQIAQVAKTTVNEVRFVLDNVHV